MMPAMTSMTEGDRGVPVAGSHRADEIGPWRAVAVFRNAVALRDTDRARTAERKRAEAEKSAAFGSGRRGIRKRYPRHRRFDRARGDRT